jgi:uncharacterized protein (DUF736 family)
MANYQNKPGQGAIFKNKKTNDKAPDYRGSVNIDGKDWEISGWSKQTKTGDGYLSISVKEPYNKGAAVEQHNKQAETFTDNLPF